jgi:hypothetical protein
MALFSAVIPSFHKEHATPSSDVDFVTAKPTGAQACVGVRVNDVTSGTSLGLKMAGVTVAYDNCAVGEEIAGNFTGTVAASTTVDSIIAYYV